MRGFALAATISHVAAHVAMNLPPAWQDPDGRYGLKSGCAHPSPLRLRLHREEH